MTAYVPLHGVQLETSFTPDAKTRIPCPYCTHLIPDVQPTHLMIDPVTGTAAWIDCACFTGQGVSPYNVVLTGCDCYARFRVQYAAGNRYTVVNVDYATMEARRVAREEAAQEATLVVALPAESDTTTEDVPDTQMWDGVSRTILSEATLVDAPPKPKRTTRKKQAPSSTK